MGRRILESVPSTYGATPKDKKIIGEQNFFCNSNNILGIICSCVFIFFTLYSIVITSLLVKSNDWSSLNGIIVCVLFFMTLWSHMTTMLSDPGVIPYAVRPLSVTLASGLPITMCTKCNTFKPNLAHHDSVSNRCISRMDHFCEWTNNAIGAKNQKVYILFLLYLSTASIYSISLFGIRLANCQFIHCYEDTVLQVYLVRIMVAFLVISLAFTSSMLVSQIVGIITGLGSIDRRKLSKKDTICSTGPLPLNHVFGDDWYLWWLPAPPYFRDPEKVLNYCLNPTVGYTADGSTTL